MQVLFLQDVKHVAHKGDIKQVKEGYFQNFLAPRKLAMLANPSMQKQAENMKQTATIRKERLVEQVQDVKKKLDGLTIKLSQKANGDKLYGSVAEKDVVDAVMKAAKVELDKSNVKMAEHIKTVGSHNVMIHLAEGIEANITVDIKGAK